MKLILGLSMHVVDNGPNYATIEHISSMSDCVYSVFHQPGTNRGKSQHQQVPCPFSYKKNMMCCFYRKITTFKRDVYSKI